MTKKKKILVYLGNGVQGGAAARQAVGRGHSVRVLIRNTKHRDSLAALGMEVFAADLEDRDSLVRAHEGIDNVVLQMPPRPPAHIALLMGNAIHAMRSSGVQRVLVRMGSGKPSIASDVHSFPGNQIIEDKMAGSGFPFAIVRATLYLDNLLKPDVREGISQGRVIRYPLPTAQPVAWTSTDDCALAAVTLLESEAFSGDHLVSGSAALSGEELARVFSRSLKTSIRYESIPLHEFERNVDLAMGVGMGKRLSALYRFIEAHPEEGNRILAQSFQPSLELSGFQPQSIGAWVSERQSAFAL